MPEDKNFHMSAEEFRKAGRQVIDWIADYWETVESLPVTGSVQPGEVYGSLPEAAPEEGEAFEALLKDMDDKILPGMTHWQHPGWHAYFPANVSAPSVLGDLLCSGLGVQGMMWSTGPACTEVETLVMDWLVQAMGLPEAFHSKNRGGGVIQDTASSATLVALVAAREQASGGETNREGCRKPLVAYTSSQAHSHMLKDAAIAGIGKDFVRLIPVNDKLAMDPLILQAQIKKDRDEGLQPFFVMATVGTTSTMAMDPLTEIGEVAAKERLWFHVDAAMAGSAALVPEFRAHFEGLDLADSYCFNPHKWMFTNFDCSALWVRRKDHLIEALTINPEYLRNRASESGQVIDYRDWQLPLGRRFRALKLWFVLRHYGLKGLQHHIRQHVEWASELGRRVEGHPQLELVRPQHLNLVCFRHKDGDEASKSLLEAINQNPEVYLTHTVVHDRFTIRLCIGQANTRQKHVEHVWSLILAAAGGSPVEDNR